jgi:pimeloyl-ACP methyl ester carboxylesterase
MVKSLATVIYNTVKRMIQKRDHGFYPTIIEEILREIYVANLGAWFWKQMKDKAAEMWLPDTTQVPSADLTQHAGTYLLRSLNKYGDETGQDITVDLVGHSAGSIAVAELMAVVANYPRLKIRHIIYMAPAVTSKLFKEKVIARAGQFKTFRMFTMSDDYETKDMMLGYVYPRSLLYFVSGCLETCVDEYILGMERYLRDAKPYSEESILKDIRTFLQSSPNMYVYAVTAQDAVDGLKTFSKHHGDFDNDTDGTLKSMMSIIMTP